MKKLKFLLTIALIGIAPVFFFTGCASIKYVKVKQEIAPYIFETTTYESLDYDFADTYFAENFDNWGGGCSAIATTLNGHTFIGRNMDLNISNKCAYLVRTNAGKYKTFGLAYTFRDISDDYNIVKEHGINEDFSKILPFMCDDIINSAGLYIEINMRNGECYPNGSDKFACEYTNPNAERRIYMFEVSRYVAENCSTVEEAVEYINNSDVYSKEHYWNYCFIIADKNDNKVLVEFAQNKVYYTYDSVCQTNFYRNAECYNLEDMKVGLGRFNTLQNEIGAVTNINDLYGLMDKISYSNFYKDYADCKANNFDPRSENIGAIDGYIGTSDFILDNANEALYAKLIAEYLAPIKTMTRQQKQDLNELWESSFTEVIDINKSVMYVRFFENADLIFEINFNSCTKTNIFDMVE